jgi:polysaccharide export outer membrane protein
MTRIWFPRGLSWRTPVLLVWALLACRFADLRAADTRNRASVDEGFGATEDYRLGPGDVMDITVFEVEELSKPAVVAPDGTVELPLVGVVEVSGLTARETASRLAGLYGDNLVRNPQISVTVREYHSQPASVLGAVSRPGVYQLRGSRRLSDVLALAEGLSPESGGEITISRPLPLGGEKTFSVATRELLRLSGKEEDNPFVQGGDTIRVAKAGLVYVVGEVTKAGGFPLKDQEQITVLKALSLAEGLRRDAAPQKTRIIRKQGDAQQETPVRLRDILDGRTPDLPLAPNDILFVPNSRAKTVLGRAAEAAIQMTTGLVIWRF